MNDIAILYAVNVVESQAMTFLLSQKVVTPEQSIKITEMSQKLTKSLGEYALELVDGFGIPEHMITAPIAKDWTKFNESDNQGEILFSKSHL